MQPRANARAGDKSGENAESPTNETTEIMKTTFEYDHAAAVEKACEYSENPETLRALIARLKIEVGPHTVIPSPWNGDARRPLKALHMLITVEGFTFPYYGSHNDAETMGANVSALGGSRKEKKTLAALLKARKEFKTGLLYSLLYCIGADYSATYSDPEDMGFDRDSIKDMAKWNEIREHARKLQAALHLTPEELESLPS